MIGKILTAGALAASLAACDAGRDADNQARKSDVEKPATTAGTTTSPATTPSTTPSTSPSTTGAPASGAAGKPASSDTTAGQKMDDTTITSKVKTALMADPDIKGMSINVDTKNGEVKLSGNVKNDAQAKKAMEIARGVNGVTGVQNNLEVKPSS